MSLISCDDCCIYQKDGYCTLETPTAVNNSTAVGCAHYVSLNKTSLENISTMQQTPL